MYSYVSVYVDRYATPFRVSSSIYPKSYFQPGTERRGKKIRQGDCNLLLHTLATLSKSPTGPAVEAVEVVEAN